MTLAKMSAAGPMCLATDMLRRCTSLGGPGSDPQGGAYPSELRLAMPLTYE
jgi:hypothetical protein